MKRIPRPLVSLPPLLAALLAGAPACGGAGKYSAPAMAPIGGGEVASEATTAERRVQLSSLGGGGTAGSAHVTQAPGQGQSEVAAPAEMIVVEAWLTVAVDDVPGAVAAVSAEVRARGGRIVEESVGGSEPSWVGSLRIRIPPAELDALLDFAAGRGDVKNRQVQGTDVSKEYFDQEIALRNFVLTLARLEKLLEREGLEMKEVLEIEKEMTRLRGEIEQVKGRLRFLADRVQLSTLHIRLVTREDAEFAPRAKIRPGPRATALFLVDEEAGERLRVGFGAALHLHRLFTVDLDLFPGTARRGRGVIATLGSATYSDFLGRGRRRTLNPFLGFRVGYAHLEESSFVLGAEAGVELFKHEYLLVEGSVRALGLVRGEGGEIALQGALTVNLPF